MRYLSNAMSLGMLADSVRLDVSFLEPEQAAEWMAVDSWESCVGHSDTALLLSALLDVPVEMRRVSLSLLVGDEMLVAQYTGPRLPEGTTVLPEGAKIRWCLVLVR
jgi:hypothetical protein